MSSTLATEPEQTTTGHVPYLKGAVAFLFWAVVFGVAYTQAPLYYSNQNQYFLHGLAQAGYGHLGNDWLAHTADPTPLFTQLVAFTYRYLPPWLFHVYYVVLLGVYFVSLLGIFTRITRPAPTPLTQFLFAVALAAVHSGLLRLGIAQLNNVDYAWYFHAGVAGQYLLGPVFQPSAFGVLLLLSVYLFLCDRPYLAVLCSSLAAVAHFTYLLSAGILTLCYLYALLWDGRRRDALRAAALALLLVLPSLIFNVYSFGPTTPESFAEAQRLLAHFRIPHHAEVTRWCDAIAVAQVLWVILAILLARGSRLCPILAITTLVSVLLTLAQLASGSDTLALLFPWRTSVFLVPLATTVLLGRIVAWAAAPLERGATLRRSLAWGVGAGVLGTLFVGGIVINAAGLAYRTNLEGQAVMEYVKDHPSDAAVYLLPFNMPRPELGSRGAVMSDFKSLTPPPPDGRPIPFELQRFRLSTGAAIFVDSKSIPYRDDEVLAWYERLKMNQRLYEQVYSRDKGDPRDLLKQYGITHVITKADREVPWKEWKMVYEDALYRVYEVSR